MKRPLSSHRRPTVSSGRIALLVGMLLLMLAQSVFSADRNFARRFYMNKEGDLVFIGNTLLSCPTGAANCAAARAGGAYNNNSFTPMAYVDVDSDGSTFDSSSATLTLPSGSTVEFAGLYWSGDYAGTGPAQQALLKTPTSFGYNLINATTYDMSGTGNVYQSFAEVTSLVAAGGSGSYTVANVQSDVGNNDQAGWTLVVVYSNLTHPLRNYAIYDGMKYATNTTITIPVSGFLTPLSGPVVTRLGTIVYDGDYNTTGDTIGLNGTLLSDPTNPIDNSYNSTISDLGVRFSAKNPDYVNQLGFDIDRWAVPDGIIGNGTTSANITVTSPSAGEVMWVGGITFETDIYVPIIVPNVIKTATDVNGGDLVAGDVLRWNVTMLNSGLDSGVNLIATDNIPAGLTYVNNSLQILTGANSSPPAKTDASGDDQAEYISSGTPRVVFRLGTGATSAAGGTLPYLASTSFQFDTTVNSGLPAGTILTNSVLVQYSGQTIGDTFAASSAAATAVLLGPPTIAKSFVPSVIDGGQASVLTITVSNPAGNAGTLQGVTFSDTYPSGLVNAATPNAQVNCTPGSTAGTITGGVAGGNTIGMSPGATLPVNGSCTITVNVTSSTVANYPNTTSVVSSTNGGSGATGSSATLSVGKPRITKAFSPTSIVSGGTSQITFSLSNITASALSAVAFSDTLTSMTVAGSPGVTNTCGGTVEGRTGVGAWGAPASGNTEVRLTGGTMTALGTCQIQVNVTSSTMGVLPNTTTGVSSTQTGSAGNPATSVSLTVIAPPTITKSFSPTSVRANVPSTMTITVSNPNTTTTITGLTFNDSPYPANLRNDTPASPTLNCTSGSTATMTGGADNGTAIGLSGGSLAPGGSCTLTVQVEGTTAGTNPLNSTGSVTTTNAGTGTAATATLNVTNVSAPTVTKAFGAATIQVGGTTTLTITLTNTSGTTVVTGVSFTDTFPTDLVIYSTPGLGTTCGGSPTLTGVAGTDVLSISGASIPVSSSCTVTVTVTSSQHGNYFNSTGTITTTNAGTFGPATASLDVLAPPVITKSFNADAIAVSPAFSVMTINWTNPTTAATSLTGVSFTDDPFPAGMTVLSTTGLSNNCGGGIGGGANTLQGRTGAGPWGAVAVGNTAIRLLNRTLAPNASCNITVRVGSTTAGPYSNSVQISSTNGGTGNTSTAVLTVGQPDISKAFGTSPIASGATSVLTITLTNPTSSPMTSAAFTDTYPTNMTNTGTPNGTTNCASGSVVALANGNSVSLSGATIPASGSCTVTVNTTATQTVTNVIAAGALTVSGGGSNGAPASKQLLVYVPPTVDKSFSVGSMLLNGTATMTIRLTNLNSVSATSVALDDTFPTDLVLATTPNASSGCGGTLEGRTGAGPWGAPASGNTELRLTGGTINNSSYCEITADVTSSIRNSYTNHSGAVTTANIGTGTEDTATIVVMGPPTVAKSFSPSTVLTNDVSLLTITLTNPNSTAAITGAAFTDTYPSVNLVNDSTPAGSTSCTSGTVTAVAGGNSVALSGATIPAGGSCNVTVRVKSATANSYNNSTGSVTTANAGTGTAASAILTVNLPMPSLSVSKMVSVISDPINNGTFPKAIPGALVEYNINITNTGPGTVDNNTMWVTDPIPVQDSMYVNDLGGVNSGPVIFTNGTTASGLAYSFVSLSDTGDGIDFSNTNDTTWTYAPVPDGNGFDSNVKYIRVKPTGTMSAAGGGNPSFTLRFRAKVK